MVLAVGGVLENMLFRVCAETVGCCVLFRYCHHFASIALDSTIAEWTESFATVVKDVDTALLAYYWMV